MSVVTRFAPSPTGFLHIGNARTALFSWLYAKHHNGTFLLRVEDTDKERSTQEAIDVIHKGLNWLGITPDKEPVYQSTQADRHAEIAQQLVKEGKAYYCYITPEELTQLRQEAQANKQHFHPPRTWRDRDTKDAPKDVKPVIRIKAPLEGETIINDQVQGKVTVPNNQLDDFIILRSDGTPTYMLAVVVDDHDMGVTHIVRGDDHLTNTFRQYIIYNALGWDIPTVAHIPLIHGSDGAKMSKRHGALSVDAYREMGFLPEAVCNYLLRLGWSHGDDEIISTTQAIEWFDFDAIGKSPSRFDVEKLKSLNAHYIKEAANDRLLSLITEFLEEKGLSVPEHTQQAMLKGMEGLKQRAKTLLELAESAELYSAPAQPDDKAQQILTDGQPLLEDLHRLLSNHNQWEEESLLALIQSYGESKGLKLGKVAAPIRVALTGKTVSPSVFEIMAALGKKESLQRIQK